MANKDLKKEPYNVKNDEDAWWYEDQYGIKIFVKHRRDDESYRFRDTHFTIPWKTIKAALKRKDT